MRTIARKAIAYGILLMGVAATGDVAAKAPSMIQLKRVQVADGTRVALVFDGGLDLAKIKTEFFNDIIQLSMTDVSVYPAKITSVSGADLTKVFAYQYAPGLTRLRLTVRGKAEDFRHSLKLQPSGKLLTVELAGTANPALPPAVSVAPAAQTALMTAPRAVSETRALSTVKEAALEKTSEKTLLSESRLPVSEKKPLASGKPLPSPWRAFGVLGGIIGLILLTAWIIRRARGDRVSTHHKFPRFAASLMKRLGAPAGGAKASIEVIATHALGPKKSISVVKVAGRTLVLGVTDDAINLISELGDSASADDVLAEAMIRGSASAAMAPVSGARSLAGRDAPAGATAAGPAVFADIFQMETEKPASQSPNNRSRIRSRLEGMKEL